MVTVDANHPLAGENLHFDVEIADIREASQEELEHGHVHGPGGTTTTADARGAGRDVPARPAEIVDGLQSAVRLVDQGRAGKRKSLFSAASVCGSRP